MRGSELQVFDRIYETRLWADWLRRANLEDAAIQAHDGLAEQLQRTRTNGREEMVGAEKLILGLLCEHLSAADWGKLLRAPLEHAAGEGNRRLAENLFKAGAAFGKAVHAAAEGNHGSMVAFLLDSGAPIGGKDGAGDTPLHVCARTGKPEMARLLLSRGADKDALGSEGGTPIYWAAREGHIAVARVLLDAGADLTLRRLSAVSPLDTAAAKGHTDIMKLFIEAGADVNGADPDGRPALHFAAFWNQLGAVNMLMGAGADVRSTDTWGSTALCHAACRYNVELVLALLRSGAGVNVLDQNHRTPLHFAAAKAGRPGGSDVVDMLLKWGADETIADDGGKTPMDVVGAQIRERHHIADDIARTKRLLGNASGDRAWRRRGCMIMCRAFPDRVYLRGHPRIGMAGRTRSRAVMTLAEAEAATPWILEGSVVAERMRRDWAAVAMRVLGHEIEGIFRAIVLFL